MLPFFTYIKEKTLIMEEQWKVFLSYDHNHGHAEYQVSTNGSIRNSRTGKIKAPTQHGDGYLVFRADAIRYTKLVHRIVAETFIPNPENKPCVDHINGIRSDNRVENLRWVDHKENMNNPVTKHHISSGLKPHVYTKSPIVLTLEKIITL